MDRPSPDRQRLLIALAAATRFGGGIVMGTGLAVLIERTGGSPFAVSLLYPAYYGGLMLFAPAWGAVADVTGRRRAVLLFTGAGATVAILPLLLVDEVWALIGVRGLYAVFAAGFPPVMLAVVSDIGGRERRGRELGFFNSARAVGFSGGQIAAGTLLGLVAPRGLYLVVAGCSLLATVVVVGVSRETADVSPDETASPTVSDLLGEVRARLLPAPEDRAHLHTNGLRWLYVALALRNTTVMGVMSLLAVYLTSQVGAPEVWMGVVLAINPVSQTVFMYLFGRVADTSGRRPLIALGMAGSGAFAVLAGVAVVPGALEARLLVAGVAAVLIGASFSAMTTGALAFIGDVAPAGRESELMGLRSTAKGVGGVIGAPLFGGLATVAGFSAAFFVGSTLSFLAAGMAWRRLVEPATEHSGATPAGD